MYCIYELVWSYPICIIMYIIVSTEVACVVTPKQGTALVFNHDTLHEGLPVTEGIKYIIRTEIMYRRVDREMIPDPLQYQTNENYLTTFALYKKSWELEQGYLYSIKSLYLR